MYFTTLPDHTQPGFDEAFHFNQFRKHNIIFHAVSNKSNCDSHQGCLSIKTVLTGEEWYGIDGRELAVRPGQFLILNDEQEYSSRVLENKRSEILSIFFKREFASAVFRNAACSEENLLDIPHEAGKTTPEFFQTLHDMDPRLLQKLSNLTATLDDAGFGYNQDMVDEQLVFILLDLLRTHKNQVNNAQRVGAVRTASKREIYKRLCAARDFLHSNFMDRPNLSSVSNAACLSTPQLIRQFRNAFNTTPHQYLTSIRLAHAAGLLTQTLMPVQEITWKSGFENTSAFCRAFKRAYGVPPLEYRTSSE